MRIVLLCTLALVALSCASGPASESGRGSAVRQISDADAAGRIVEAAAEEAAEQPNSTSDKLSSNGSVGNEPAGVGGEPLDGAAVEVQLDRLIAASGADRVAAITDDDRVFLWTGGQHTQLAGSEVVAAAGLEDNPNRQVFAHRVDEEFVYWYVDEGGDAEPRPFTLLTTTHEGDVVCALDELVHPDIPAFAVDCQDGSEQAIEPFVTDLGDGQTEIIEQIAGKKFTFLGDAEGNADLFNASGIIVNGSDYAGSYGFDRAAERVLYGDFGVSPSPHITRNVVARTTADGELLWRAELDGFTTFHGWTESVAVVTISEPDALVGELSTVAAVVLDADTGAVVERLPMTLRLSYLS